MPELPDITLYIEAIGDRVIGRKLQKLEVLNPFTLRSVTPGVHAFTGLPCMGLNRMGKRIALMFESELAIVLHLMIAGRLHWKKPSFKPPRRNALALFRFENGCLFFTESSSKKRAWIRLIQGREALDSLDPGALEVLDTTFELFQDRVLSANHTLKRCLTDPRIFSGIGNAYSDEILHRARLSPFLRSNHLDDTKMRRLYDATQSVLKEWIQRLRKEASGSFPAKVTAFRPEMAAHGRFRQPCPECGTPIQRIRYAERECNYCPECQTQGKLLADRSLSKLLKDDWPKRWEDLEARH